MAHELDTRCRAYHAYLSGRAENERNTRVFRK